MYNTKTAIINNDEFQSNYLPVGINDSITLKEVSVKKSQTGKDFIEIIFEDKDERTVSMSEWENEKNMWIKTDEELQKRNDLQFGRFMQIINCYYPEVEDVTLNSFSDMINWVKSKLDPVISNKKSLRLKVVYNKRGYTTVSSNGIFVEPMDITNSQIKLFKRDLLERPIQADIEKSEDPLIGNIPTNNTDTPVKSENDSDLPF